MNFSYEIGTPEFLRETNKSKSLKQFDQSQGSIVILFEFQSLNETGENGFKEV